MKLDTRRIAEIIEAARGDRPADLCVHGGRLVNVISGQIEAMDLAIYEGYIVGWGDYAARETINAEGLYVCPGFIDGHLHIESTLLSPSRFCAAALRWGTSAVVADPHEIANVLGLDGIRYFLAASEALPLDIYIKLPSCVPASPLGTCGAQLRASDLSTLLPHERILGLAEMMNFPGVIQAQPDVLDKLILFQDQHLDGHAPQLSGLKLNSYLVAGITSDHECTSLSEAQEKLAKGMTIMLRQGSQSKDLADLLPVITQHSWPRCMLVTDDCHPDDLLNHGHMNAVVNRAMELGLSPVTALTLATWTPARTFQLPRVGAIAPGYQADFSLSPTLQPWTPVRVFKRGREVAREGRLIVETTSWLRPPVPNSPMHIIEPSAEQLKVPVRQGRMRVIGIQEGSLITTKMLFEPKVLDGMVVADIERDLLKLVNYNRYQADRAPALGFVHGFGLERGALATTVAHDAHNLLAVGVSDAALLRVIEAVRGAGGGLAVGTESGRVELLPLPIAGLMSDQPIEDVVPQLERLKHLTVKYGCKLHNPFMALSFLALEVIPELKLTDLGLVETSTFTLVPLFDES